MPALLHNATIVTPQHGTLRVLPAHSLVFEAGRVTELAPASAFDERLAREEFDPVIIGTDCIAVPGLVNTHHHLYQSLTRCLPAAQNRRLFHWLLSLYDRWVDVDFAAIQAAARVSIAELLLHGCTTTSDHFYLFPPQTNVRAEAVLAAAEELGIRIHLARGAMTLGQSAGGLPPDDCVESDERALADCARLLEQFHDTDPYAKRRIDLAPCSPFNVTRELMQATRDLARSHGALLHTHLAETLDEERFCLQHYDRRPIAYLRDLDWLGPDVYLAHCVHLNADEIATLAQTDTAVSHNPSSNCRLGSGIAPLEPLLQAGVRVGLGVDGSSSNDGGNLLAATRQALYMARTRTALAEAEQPASPATPAEPLFPAAQALLLATQGGAQVLRRDVLGHLNPGAAADFALFRTDDVALAGAVTHDPVAALVLCDAPRAAQVFVGGEEVVRDGHLLHADESALAIELNASARRFR